ncbi:unnamed protein product [Closterium sp. NIES-54]
MPLYARICSLPPPPSPPPPSPPPPPPSPPHSGCLFHCLTKFRKAILFGKLGAAAFPYRNSSVTPPSRSDLSPSLTSPSSPPYPPSP